MGFIKHSPCNFISTFVLFIAIFHFWKINFNFSFFISQKSFTIIYIHLKSSIIRYPFPISEININLDLIILLYSHFCIVIYGEIKSIFIKIWCFNYIHIFIPNMVWMNLGKSLTIKVFTIKFKFESIFLGKVIKKAWCISSNRMHIRIIIFILLSALL
jgi:hypothetical protein